MPNRDVFAAWQLEPLSRADFQRLNGSAGSRLGADGLYHLLQFSLLAPSTHNSVPQAYEVDAKGQRIALSLRRRYVLPASDPSGRQALISMGCAVENLVIAAGAYGFEASWTIDPALCWDRVTHADTDSNIRVGQVQFRPAAGGDAAPPAPETLRALRDRKVVRAEFDGAVRLPSDLVQEFTAGTDFAEPVRLHLFETEREKFAWGKLDELATKHKLEQRPFQIELGRWLLPDDDTTTARGMRGREFGLEAPLAARLSAQLRGEVPMAVDQLAFMARAARAGLTSCSAVCAISYVDRTPGCAMEAGRMYQRTALRAFRAGFANSVHTAVCEVTHARKMCEATLLGGRTPAVVFRLGKPLHADDWQRPHSSRPALEDLLRR
jgi:hypothetical protein